jgi:hypothetical protein
MPGSTQATTANPYNDDPNAGGGISEPNPDNLTMTCSGTFSNGNRVYR